MSTLALVPARAGSRAIPNKNFRMFEAIGLSPLQLAISAAEQAGIRHIVVSSDIPHGLDAMLKATGERLERLYAGPPLHTDECAMIDVVKHALAAIPGPQDQIILLVQPTQVLRQPKHLQAAIELLEASKADSVVSVVEVPSMFHPDVAFHIWNGELMEYGDWDVRRANRRQDLPLMYARDGTVYAFRRATVSKYDNIYGQDVRPLIIPAEETCPLDTPADWADAERRLHDRAAGARDSGQPDSRVRRRLVAGRFHHE